MTKILRCNDLNPGCTYEARGNNEAEVLWATAEHAKTKHGVPHIPAEVIPMVRGLIREELLQKEK